MFPLPIISNTSISPTTREMVFGLYDFNSTADIIDRSGNAIAVENHGGVTVGSNEHGTYIDFRRITSQWLNVMDDLLKLPEYDVELAFSGYTDSNSQYGDMILDTRYTDAYEDNMLEIAVTNYNTMYTTAGASGGDPVVQFSFDPTIKNKYLLKVRSTGIEIFMNDILIVSNPMIPLMTHGRLCIGRNVFSTTQHVIMKMHSFKVFKPLI